MGFVLAVYMVVCKPGMVETLFEGKYNQFCDPKEEEVKQVKEEPEQ